MRALAILLALGALALASPAAAQSFQVVGTCATPNGTFSVGQVANATMNTNGVVCTSASGGGGGAVTIADGADVTLGAKADAKSAATDTTAITIMQVLKEISAMEQAPASRAVTNTGTFAVQAAINASSHCQTTALAASLVCGAPATKLRDFTVTADSTLNASAWYIMLFDATSLPANGAVTPEKCYQVPAGVGTFGGTFADGGITQTTGLTIGVSTSGCFTLTSSTHALFIGGTYQ